MMRYALAAILLILYSIAATAELPYLPERAVNIISNLEEQSGGTIFMVTPHYGITSQHVVNGRGDYFKVFKQGTEIQLGELVHEDKNRDLALIHIEDRQPWLTLCDEEPPAGAAVMSFGYPKVANYMFTAGLLSGKHWNNDNLYVTDVNVRPGMSGGPLMDIAEECVIGVNMAGSAYDIRGGTGTNRVNTLKQMAVPSYHNTLPVLKQFIQDGILKHEGSK